MSFASKKGSQPIDIIFSVIGMFTFIVMVIIGYVFLTGIQDTGLFEEDTAGGDIYHERADSYPRMWDYAFLFLLIGLWVALIFSSFLLDTLPGFFVIALLVNIAFLFTIPYLANTFLGLTTMGALEEATESFPFMVFFMQNTLIIVILQVFSTLIALYAKTRMPL